MARRRRSVPGALHSDGRPDLNGIWQALNTANWNIEAHSAGPSPVRDIGAIGAVPAGLGVVEGGTIPYRPEALAKRREHYQNRLALDPEVKCYMPGVPRATYMPFPFQIVQSRQHIMRARNAGMCGPSVSQTGARGSWMGRSNGRWSETPRRFDRFNDRSWFDRAGNFHATRPSSASRPAPIMQYEATLRD
jgi:hypothetical protein